MPVIRVKLAKNYSALVLIESTAGFATILPQLVAMKKRKKKPLSLLDREPPLLGQEEQKSARAARVHVHSGQMLLPPDSSRVYPAVIRISAYLDIFTPPIQVNKSHLPVNIEVSAFIEDSRCVIVRSTGPGDAAGSCLLILRVEPRVQKGLTVCPSGEDASIW